MSYVDAGYAIALSVLALYAGALLARRRRLERGAHHGGRAPASGWPSPAPAAVPTGRPGGEAGVEPAAGAGVGGPLAGEVAGREPTRPAGTGTRPFPSSSLPGLQ